MSQPNNNNNGDDHKYKKIFVGGLAWIVTTDGLRSFCQEHYGEVLEANVVSETLPDGNLKSKGYGFVTFRDAESANRACQSPHPIIEGRQTNINLAYLRVKNNANHSNQTGLQHQAGPSHQYQNGSFNQMAWHPYQNGWYHQGAWHQYPLVNANPQFPVYWGSNYGANPHMYGVSHYYYSSTVNCYQTNSVRPARVSQPPRGPRFEDITDPNPEAASAADVVSDVNSGEDNETGSDIDQQMGKDQEGEISGQENGTKQDVKDQEGEMSGQDNGIKQDVKNEQEKIVSGEDDDTKHGEGATNQLCFTLQIETVCDAEESEKTPQENGLDHEEKTHMEAGLI